METRRLSRWLRGLRGAATFVYITALCLAVALVVIGFIPHSRVGMELPIASLSGLDGAGGVVPGVVVDPSGAIAFKVPDASLGQRMLYVMTYLPGLLLVAEIARRMAKLLRAAHASDPFTPQTARDLIVVSKITAFGGVGVWAVSNVAAWVLSATMLNADPTVVLRQSPVGWLAVGLIFAAFGQLVARGVAMRAELDTVI